MKKIIFFFVCSVLSFSAYTCDVCGSGAMNSTQGLSTVSQGNRTSIGLNYQYRLYKSEHPKLVGPGIEKSQDLFQRIDLQGQVRLVKRWQLQLSVPFAINSHKEESDLSKRSGLGDPTLVVNYFLYNKQDSVKSTVFRWIIGAGVKSPLGKFTKPLDAELYLYPGTGTFDALFQSSLFFKKKKWSILQSTQYILRGENKHKYIPGSLLNASIFGQYQFRTWGIFAGSQYSWSGLDYINRKAISSAPTQGHVLTAILGATMQWKKWVLQGAYHLPYFQELSAGKTKQKTTFNISLHYFLN